MSENFFQVNALDLLVCGRKGLGPLRVIEEQSERVILEVPGETLHWVVHKSRGRFVNADRIEVII